MKGALVVVRPTWETVLIVTPGSGAGRGGTATAPGRPQNNRAAGAAPPSPGAASLAAATLCGSEGAPVLFSSLGAPAPGAAPRHRAIHRRCRMQTATLAAQQAAHATFPINGTDYLELRVGNAQQAALYYRAAFGFRLVGYRGPETGVRDRASYLLEQHKRRFVLTSSLGPEGPISDHVRLHGDGVRDIAFWVDDARDAYAKAVERGAR